MSDKPKSDRGGVELTLPHVVAARKSRKQMDSRRRRPENKWRHTAAYKRLRDAFIRGNPKCVICEAEGRFTIATVVDHIEPVSEGGNAFDWGNLQSLCETCHNRKTGREVQARRRKRP